MSHGWRVQRTEQDLDDRGWGRVVYRIEAEQHVFHFVAFCRTIDDSQRTDRVVATSWDVTAALVEGELTPQLITELQREVPLQEQSHFEAEVLVLTRANRSVRYFDYASDCLAEGRQPEVNRMGPSPYLLRSTAYYGNGKFGLKQFATLPADHPLAVPYRSQMLSAWVLREVSIDILERVAHAKGRDLGGRSVRLDSRWRRYLGVGNATGLGMVPFVVTHPEYLDAWCLLREVPLAAALSRAYAPDAPELAHVGSLLERADLHLAEKDELATAPFPSAREIRAQLRLVRDALDEYRRSTQPPSTVLRRLHDYATQLGLETRGIVAASAVDLTSELDEQLDAMLTTAFTCDLDARMTCGQLSNIVATSYAWVSNFDFSQQERTAYYWFNSRNNEEPRRSLRRDKPDAIVEHCTDIARRVWALSSDLTALDADMSLGEFLVNHPEHRFAAARVQSSRALTFGELHQNLLDADFVPLNVQ
ncbi:MAG: hypothetical protein ABI065_07480, partial [Terrimesophilobacter sp.]